MKIAMVSDAIYPYNKGGKERKIYEIATRIAAKGHEVHIYTMKEIGKNVRIEIIAIKIIIKLIISMLCFIR